MKKFGLWIATAFALLAIAACSDDEIEEVKGEDGQDDSYWASLATVTSDSPYYTTGENEGSIHFNTSGGTVTLNVDCGVSWYAETSSVGEFRVSWNEDTGSVTVVAHENYGDEQKGSFELRTSEQRIIFAMISIVQTAYGVSVETNEWHAPAVGALTTEIGVQSPVEDYNVEVDSDGKWLTVKKTATGISLTAAENEWADERRTKVTVTASDEMGAYLDTISVIQDGRAYLILSSETVSLSPFKGSASVSVESNFDWDFSYDGSNGWLTVIRDGDTLEVSVTDNDVEEEREGTITLTAGDGAENTTEVKLSVVQDAADLDPLILEYTTTASTKTIQLPLSGTVNCTVNWGDGSSETVTSTNPSHTYGAEGTYTVTIEGTVTALSYYGLYSVNNRQTTLTGVKQWGNTGLTDMGYAFYYCQNLSYLPENAGEVFANVNTFDRAFVRCESLTEITANLFGTCPMKVTDFHALFENCISLKAIPAGLFDNCTEATSFNDAFYGCTAIETIPEGLFDKCTKVTSFSATFYDCTGITEIPAGLFDNCTAVTSFQSCFSSCRGLTEIPTGLFDKCTKVTSFYATFAYCSHITEIPAGLFDKCTKATSFGYCFDGFPITTIPAGIFDNCPSVTNFEATFYNCTGITEIPTGLFDKCTNVTNFSFTFSYCYYLKTIPKGLFDKCTKVTNFSAAFQQCQSIEEIPAGLFDNCTKMTDFSWCFSGCYGLTAIPEGLFDSCPNVTDFSRTFQGCGYVTEVPVGLFDKNLKATTFDYTFTNWVSVTGESPYTLLSDGTKVHLYERSSYTSQMGCVAPTSYSSCFTNSSFSDIDSIPTNWGGGTSTSSISSNRPLYLEASPEIEP